MLISIFDFFKYLATFIIDSFKIVSEKVIEWSQEPLYWIYLIVSFVVLLLWSNGYILSAILVFILGFSIEKRSN